jgi:carboxypeptidase PM20D1
MSPYGVLPDGRTLHAVAAAEKGYLELELSVAGPAGLSLRLLPGSTADDVERAMRAVAADDGLEVRRLMYKPPNSSSFTTGHFRALVEGCLLEDPLAAVTPILSPAASDARHWRAAGVPAFGWVPFPVPAADIHTIHGVGERLAVDSFRTGLRTYFRVLAQLATTAAPDRKDDAR